MRKTLRVLALVLALLLSLSVFAGCKKEEAQGASSMMTQSEVAGDETDETVSGEVASDEEETKDTSSKKNNSSKKNSSTKSSSKKTSSKKQQNSNKLDINPVGEWPIVNKPITFEFYGIADPTYADAKDMSFYKYFEEKTNIKVNYVPVAEGKMGERKTLALQSKDMPDLFIFYNNVFSQAEFNKYGDSKKPLYANLLDYIEYAPNMAKEMTEEFKTLNTTPGGNILKTPGKSAGPNGEMNYGHWLNIRKDWLVNLYGSEDAYPKTTTELLQVLKDFRDNDPNGNQQQDEMPFAQWVWSADFILSMWGVKDNYGTEAKNLALDNDGKVFFWLTHDRAKQASTFWRDVTRRETGLIDLSIQNQYDNGYAKFKTHINKGNVGCFWWNGLEEPDFSEELLKKYMPIPFPTANYPDDGLNLPKAVNPGGQAVSVGGGGKVVSTTCANIPALMRYLDYFYTDEGIMLGNWGAPTNGLYKKNADGSYTITTTDTAKAKKEAPAYTIGIPQISGLSKKVVMQGKETEYTRYKAKAAEVYSKAHLENPVTVVPSVPLTSSDLAKLRKFEPVQAEGSALSAYVDDWYKMENWVTWAQGIEKKGVKEYVKFFQGIYDKYKSSIKTSADRVREFQAASK